MDDVGGGGEIERRWRCRGSAVPRDGGGKRGVKKRGTRIEEIQEKGLFQAITHEETKAGCFLSMLPTGHRNLGKEKTLDRMRKGMTALLDLV